MNLNSLILSSAILFSGFYSDNILYELPTNTFVDYLKMSEDFSNLDINESSDIFRFIVYCDNSNVYIDFSKDDAISLDTITISGDLILEYLDGNSSYGGGIYCAIEPLTITGDGSGNNQLNGDFWFSFFYEEDSGTNELFNYHTDIDYELFSDEILNSDGTNINGEYQAEIFFSDDLDFNEFFTTFINDYYEPDSYVDSLFDTIGETITAYVSSITTMFNELMLLFYADNKLTYLSQLLLVGIGIGITKWGMNFVKDRVRL